MTRDRTLSILASIVALAAPVLGASVSGCAACPSTQESSSDPINVEATSACDSVATMRRAGNFGSIPDQAECASICDNDDVGYCTFDFNYTQAFDTANPDIGSTKGGDVACPEGFTTVVVTCVEQETSIHWSLGGCPIDGRRPAGLEAPALPAAGSGCGPAGAHLAQAAHLEAASVIAFQTLADDLRDLGAPEALIADALEAKADEVRHTKMTTRLARSYGVEPPPVIAPPRAIRSALEIALENAVEGVIREAFGAAVALHQAQRAQDPAVRAAFAAIAVDECSHASLAMRVDAFFEGRLTEAELSLVAAAKRDALDELLAALTEPSVDLASRLGLPSVAASRRILAAMQAELWAFPLAA